MSQPISQILDNLTLILPYTTMEVTNDEPDQFNRNSDNHNKHVLTQSGSSRCEKQLELASAQTENDPDTNQG